MLDIIIAELTALREKHGNIEIFASNCEGDLEPPKLTLEGNGVEMAFRIVIESPAMDDDEDPDAAAVAFFASLDNKSDSDADVISDALGGKI